MSILLVIASSLVTACAHGKGLPRFRTAQGYHELSGILADPPPPKKSFGYAKKCNTMTDEKAVHPAGKPSTAYSVAATRLIGQRFSLVDTSCLAGVKDQTPFCIYWKTSTDAPNGSFDELLTLT